MYNVTISVSFLIEENSSVTRNHSFSAFKCEEQPAPDNNTAVVCSAGTEDDVYCSVSCLGGFRLSDHLSFRVRT